MDISFIQNYLKQNRIIISPTISCVVFTPNQLNSAEITQILLKGDDEFDPPIHDSVKIHQYSDKLSLYANALLICERQNVAGNLFYYVNQSGFVYITHINIYADYRHKHLGHLLINQIKELYKNCDRIDLEVRKNNVNAYLFYQREGFVVKEDRGEKYLMSMPIK